jgi:predicted transposase YbfD/YdcC
MALASSMRLDIHFATLKDPRVRQRCDHRFLEVILMAFCAAIGGCNDWQQVEMFVRHRIDWFRKFLRLPNGIPSHDTFERLFDQIDPLAFQRCFCQWLRAVTGMLPLPHIAIDGKTLRNSGAPSVGLKALHLVSAWATEAHLSLGQIAVDEKSNEITAIPRLLELLDLHGVMVTIDAMGCQKAIAEKIVDGGGDYALTVKENHRNLLEDIQTCLIEADEVDFAGIEHDFFQTRESGHGREELRNYTLIYNPTGIRHMEEWKGMQVIGMCYRERTIAGKTSHEVHYFIGSARATAQQYATVLRQHWRIENNLHWQLDVSFREDENRVQKRQGATNLALLRRVALCLLKQHPSKKSINLKRLEALLNTDFLEEVLRGTHRLGDL